VDKNEPKQQIRGLNQHLRTVDYVVACNVGVMICYWKFFVVDVWVVF